MTEILKLELQLKMMKSDLLKYLKEYHINYNLFHFLVGFDYELESRSRIDIDWTTPSSRHQYVNPVRVSFSLAAQLSIVKYSLDHL